MQYIDKNLNIKTTSCNYSNSQQRVMGQVLSHLVGSRRYNYFSARELVFSASEKMMDRGYSEFGFDLLLTAALDRRSY